MNITVVTPRFAISGVPLAQLRFAESLARRGHRVDLLIGCVNKGFTLPQTPGVNVVVLGREKARHMLLPLMAHVWRARPELIFSAEDHLNVLVLIALILTGSKARMSGSSRVTPFDTYSSRVFSKRWFLKQFARATMWRATTLTCVSKDMVEQYRKVFRNPPHRAVYNIVDSDAARQRIAEPVDIDWLLNKEVPVIVAAGQLEPWKGFADLIEAFAIVAARRPVRLIVFGEGSLRASLEARLDSLGLRDRVRLPGNVPNPLKYFTRADVFALTSHVEGMPNALVEAMLCGCTPVATDCPTGPRELLGDKYGYLAKVGDARSIAECLEKALDCPIDKKLLAEATRPFSEEAVITRHFSLLGLPEEVTRAPNSATSR